jgi:N-acyl-D-amino-acid deacylase
MGNGEWATRVFDVIVTGGRLLDGTGAPAWRADVAVTAGRIVAVGRFPDLEAHTVIDATDRFVAPGFVDAHSHADAAVLDPAVQLALLRQGVTTVILGQDGLSYAPATPAALAFVTGYFAAINGSHPDLSVWPVSVADLLDTWRGTTPLNTAYLIPHGTVRFGVLGGEARAATPAELSAMRAVVERGLTEGSVGLSSGLEYLPGRHGDATELAELCAPVAAAGLPYVTHMRGYGTAAAAGLAEATAIGAAAGVAVHVSHLHGPGPAVVSMVDEILAQGTELTFDSYPYLRGCTILSMAALPHWLDDVDADRVVAALGDSATRAKVIAGLNPDLWPRVTLASVPHPDWRWAEGRGLVEAAATVGTGPGELLLELLAATRLAASAVIAQPSTTDEAGLRTLLRHPAHIGGSDGIFIGGHPHPRGWGTFARFLGRHVRELGDWTWPEAVEHLAAHPARRFGLTDRGVLRPGLAADLVVIDPATVSDRADYVSPRELAVGVDDVLVHGVPVLRGGTLTGQRPGRPLTPYPGA